MGPAEPDTGMPVCIPTVGTYEWALLIYEQRLTLAILAGWMRVFSSAAFFAYHSSPYTTFQRSVRIIPSMIAWETYVDSW